VRARYVAANLFVELVGVTGQVADLAGDDRKTPASLTGTGSLDRCVECQQIGFFSDGVDVFEQREYRVHFLGHAVDAIDDTQALARQLHDQAHEMLQQIASARGEVLN